MPLQVTNWLRFELRMAPEGQSPVRTSPLASELPLTCEALPFAGAASPLTCPPAAANPSTFAALTTPGGLRSLRSASSLSFLVILLPQNNSLTFVRGACRAYCAPRKSDSAFTGACHAYCAPRKSNSAFTGAYRAYCAPRKGGSAFITPSPTISNPFRRSASTVSRRDRR